MVLEQSEQIIREIKKAFIGKDDIVRKVMMTIYAGGNILLEDIPGVGKTTLALAFSKALGLDFKRIQFTTDTMPSDITGFTVYNRQTGKFQYREGAVNCNILLADEINRTSPKTQSALLEAMAEKTVTVDGETHVLDKPFICIATQNPQGSAGTKPLPESQLDRFMVCMSIGYPTLEEQKKILNIQRYVNPLESIVPVTTREAVLEVQDYLNSIHLSDEVMEYIITLCQATRELPLVELGVSPRGVSALSRMAKAHAILSQRSFVIPEDVQNVFGDVCAHRIIMKPAARVEGVTARELLKDVLAGVRPPIMSRSR